MDKDTFGVPVLRKTTLKSPTRSSTQQPNSASLPSSSSPAPAHHRTPPPRVMEERKDRDTAHRHQVAQHEARQRAQQHYNDLQHAEAARFAASPLEDALQKREQQKVDRSAVEFLKQLESGVHARHDEGTAAAMRLSPIVSARGDHGEAETGGSEEDSRDWRHENAEREKFFKAIGVPTTGPSLTSAASSPFKPSSTMDVSVSSSLAERRRSSVATLTASSPAPTLAGARLSTPHSTKSTAGALPPQRRLSTPSAPSRSEPANHVTAAGTGPSSSPKNKSNPLQRTLVATSRTLRTFLKTKPLAPIPLAPSMISTVIPDRHAGDLNAETILTQFKRQQVDERDYAIDLKSRKMAEEHDGTLIHLEMTQSISRVSGIVSALETGKPFRDVVTYNDAKEMRDRELEREAQQRGGAGGGGDGGGSDEATPEELREVIQVLLKDNMKQSGMYQELERQLRTTQGELAASREESKALRDTVTSLQATLDALVVEKDKLQKELSRAQATIALLQEQLSSTEATLEQVAASKGSKGHPQRGHGSNKALSASTLKGSTQAHNAASSKLLVPSFDLALGTPRSENGEDSVLTPTVSPMAVPLVPVRLDGASIAQQLNPAMPSMQDVPQGEDVTIVATAVQGVDALWEHAPQDMITTLSMHNRVLTDLVPLYRGYQVKTAGEEFLVAFASTVDAVNFAVKLQDALVELVWPQSLSQVKGVSDQKKKSTWDSATNNEALDAALPPSQRDMAAMGSGGVRSGSETASNEVSKLPVGHQNWLWNGVRVAVGIHCGPVHIDFNPATQGFDYMGSTVNRALLLKRVSFGGMAASSKEVYDRVMAQLDKEDLQHPENAQASQRGLSFAESARASTRRSSRPHAMMHESQLATSASLRNAAAKAANKIDPHHHQPSETLLIPITTSYHCRIPAGKHMPPQDVYCLLPSSLEERLDDIHAATKAIAAANNLNLDSVMAPAEGDDQPSELEALLGAFSRRGDQPAKFITRDGVLDVDEMPNEEQVARDAIRRSGLPKGEITLLTVRSEGATSKRLMEKLLQKDMEQLIDEFRGCVELACAANGGVLVRDLPPKSQREKMASLTSPRAANSPGRSTGGAAANTADAPPSSADNPTTMTLAFTSVAAAVRCALAVDAELTSHQWPKFVHHHPDTEEVLWRGVRVFLGLRPSQGLHQAEMAPQYDPMTRTVHYTGFNAYVSHRLAALALPGQLLMEERAAFAALATVHPRPLFTHMTSKGNRTSSSAVRLCNCISRCFVGRYFVWGGVPLYPQCCRLPQYRRMKQELRMEDTRWHRDATRVVARELRSDGFNNGSDPAAEGAGDDENGDANGMANAFASVLAAGKSAADLRLRDLELNNVFLVTLKKRIDEEELPDELVDRHSLVGHLEKLEHNLMTLQDPFYDGQVVALQPIIVDLPDLRELPMGGDKKKGIGELLAGDGGASGGGGCATNPGGDPAGGGGGDSDGERDDLEASGRRGSHVLLDVDEDDDEMEQELAIANAMARNRGGRNGAEDQSAVIDVWKRKVQSLELDVLAAHRICRQMFSVLKDWLNPLVSTTVMYMMSDDEVVSKLLSAERTTREYFAQASSASSRRVGGGGPSSSAASASSDAESATTTTTTSGKEKEAARAGVRVQWRQLLDQEVAAQEVEDRLRKKSGKLLLSMESMICRHFLFLRQYVKRIKLKERSK